MIQINLNKATILESNFDSKEAVTFNQINTVKFTNNSMFYRCKYKSCNRIFKEKGNLKTHLRVHIGDKPFECTYLDCNMKFITQGNLKSHLFNHLGVKPYSCRFEGCKNTYVNKTRLEIHSRTHNGFKPYICEYAGCNKHFNEKGNLKTHMRCHTNLKPYVCIEEGCKAIFKFSVNLKKHLKTHQSDAKDFYCVFCPNKFSRYSTLQTHLKVHDEYSKREELLLQNKRIEKPDSSYALFRSVKNNNLTRASQSPADSTDNSTTLDNNSHLQGESEFLLQMMSICEQGTSSALSPIKITEESAESDFYNITSNVANILTFSRSLLDLGCSKYSFLNVPNIKLNIATLFNNHSERLHFLS